MSKVIEVVNFKIKAEYDQSTFLKANQSMAQFLEQQQGMLLRSLCLNEETDSWVDIVYWQNMTLALAAQNAFMQSPLCVNFAEQIEKQSVIIQHITVLSESTVDTQVA